MNIPQIKPVEEEAISTIVGVLNKAKYKLGLRQNLFQLANSRNEFINKVHVSLVDLESPLSKNTEKFITNMIEKTWKLKDTLTFILRFIGNTSDESAQFLYYEALFSQPTAAYPIPQATASVFFTVEDRHLEPHEVKGVPLMTFRVEGEYSDHDVRFVVLTADRILALIKMKMNLFRRIESLKLF